MKIITRNQRSNCSYAKFKLKELQKMIQAIKKAMKIELCVRSVSGTLDKKLQRVMDEIVFY